MSRFSIGWAATALLLALPANAGDAPVSVMGNVTSFTQDFVLIDVSSSVRCRIPRKADFNLAPDQPALFHVKRQDLVCSRKAARRR